MVKITYIPTKFENTKIEQEILFDVENPWLLVHVAAFADTKEEYRHAICKERISICVNDKELDVDEWNSYEVKDGDSIVVTPTIEGGRGGFLNTIIGAILVVVGAIINAVSYGSLSWLGTPMMYTGVAMMIGGVVQMLFGVSGDITMPTFSDGSDSPTYSWEGIQLTAITDRPIGVCYGEQTPILLS